MRVFIAHKTPRGYGEYEASRVRKTLKGACELSGTVTWVDSMMAFPDVVHFIAPVDDLQLFEAKQNDCKIVVSVGYSEFDPHASFFENTPDGYGLKFRSVKTIEKADLVLVPNIKIAEKILSQGIARDVEVLSPAVNLSRFQIEDGSEKEVFLRYFSLMPQEKLVITTFDYSNKKALASLIEIARKLPDIRFYSFGTKNRKVSKLHLRSDQRKCPKNLTLCSIIDDDLYRSAMLNAVCYLIVDGSRPDCSALYEAFASKTGVVAVGDQPWNVRIVDKKTGFLAKDENEAAQAIGTFVYGKASEILDNAYEIAKECSLDKLSKKLPGVYEKLLKKEVQ